MTRASSPLTRGTTTALAVLAGLALAGCTASGGGSADVTSPTSPTPSTPEQFWGGLAMVRVTEVDPATSIDELSDRAELIVRGAAGEVDAPGDGRTRITVDVSETLAGEGAERVVVDLFGQPDEGAADRPPREELLWFLTPAEEDGRWHLVSRYGLIGEDDDGAPDTVLNPGDAWFEWGARPASLAETQAAVEESLAG